MMMSNDNMLSNNVSINTELKNKGFTILDKIFKENGWHMIKNEMNWLCYTKFGNETDLFDIKVEQTSIKVSVPMKNSPFQFVTSFEDYYRASEYMESRFLDFISENS